MKATYNRTLLIPDLTRATVKIYITDEVKYSQLATAIHEHEYIGVKAWDIISGEDAQEIETMTDAESTDENHEYLVLHFTDGTTATFRNSHTDMFIF